MNLMYLHPDAENFPDVADAQSDGLLCLGGDLSATRLQLAYSRGIFPWYMPDEPIAWYAPHRRCVIFPKALKISKSLQQIVRKNIFKITVNKCFKEVMFQCAHIQRKDAEGTWITHEMQNAYLNLHQMGLAHSIEVWQNEELVGGLYGVQQALVFCGESMFSKVSNASKIALVHLCSLHYTLIDCQIPNPHLISMGAVEISMAEYQQFL